MQVFDSVLANSSMFNIVAVVWRERYSPENLCFIITALCKLITMATKKNKLGNVALNHIQHRNSSSKGLLLQPRLDASRLEVSSEGDVLQKYVLCVCFCVFQFLAIMNNNHREFSWNQEDNKDIFATLPSQGSPRKPRFYRSPEGDP